MRERGWERGRERERERGGVEGEGERGGKGGRDRDADRELTAIPGNRLHLFKNGGLQARACTVAVVEAISVTCRHRLP